MANSTEYKYFYFSIYFTFMKKLHYVLHTPGLILNYLFTVWCRIPPFLTEQVRETEVWGLQSINRETSQAARCSVSDQLHGPSGRWLVAHQQWWQLGKSVAHGETTAQGYYTKERSVYSCVCETKNVSYNLCINISIHEDAHSVKIIYVSSDLYGVSQSGAHHCGLKYL